MAQLFKTFGASDDSIAKEILDGKVKTLLEVLIGKIKDNKLSTQFCVGDSLTIADLQVRPCVRGCMNARPLLLSLVHAERPTQHASWTVKPTQLSYPPEESKRDISFFDPLFKYFGTLFRY